MRNLWLLLSAFVVLLDYFSKVLAQAHLPLHQPVAVMPGMNLTLVYNNGAAFGLLSSVEPSWERWLLAGISLVASLVFLQWFRTSQYNLQRAALAFVIGGALGNFIDRVFYGYVVDFFDFYLGQHHWHVFNVADSAICIGVGLLLISWVKYERKGH